MGNGYPQDINKLWITNQNGKGNLVVSLIFYNMPMEDDERKEVRNQNGNSITSGIPKSKRRIPRKD